MARVKCTVCGEYFDREKVPAVKSGARRYAHERCMPNGEKVPLKTKEGKAVEVDQDLEKLERYIKNLLGEEFINVRVRRQIKEYRENYGYTYSGILKSLIYFYDVQGNSKDKANGAIGIVPYIYDKAFQYYLSLFMARERNKDIVARPINYKVKEITIKPPKVEKKSRLFNINEEDL